MIFRELPVGIWDPKFSLWEISLWSWWVLFRQSPLCHTRRSQRACRKQPENIHAREILILLPCDLMWMCKMILENWGGNHHGAGFFFLVFSKRKCVFIIFSASRVLILNVLSPIGLRRSCMCGSITCGDLNRSSGRWTQRSSTSCQVP